MFLDDRAGRVTRTPKVRPTRGPTVRIHLLLAATTLTVPLAACSGSSNAGDSPSTPSATAAATAPADPAAATAEITKNWAEFWSGKTGLAGKTALLEEGSGSLAEAL